MKKTFGCRLALALVICFCLVPATAIVAGAEYAPSIEAVPVPEIVAPSTDAGSSGVVINKGDNSTEQVDMSEVFTVSYNEAKAYIADPSASAEDKAVCEAFVAAYDALKSSGGVKESIKDIDKFVAENLDIKNPEYVVTNVFALSLGKHSGSMSDGATVTIHFSNAKIKAATGEFVVACRVGDEWKIIPSENIKITDEIIEITFDEVGPIAFLSVVPGEAVDTPDAPDADDGNGAKTAIIIVSSVVGVAAVGTATFFILKKTGVIAKLAAKGGAKK